MGLRRVPPAVALATAGCHMKGFQVAQRLWDSIPLSRVPSSCCFHPAWIQSTLYSLSQSIQQQQSRHLENGTYIYSEWRWNCSKLCLKNLLIFCLSLLHFTPFIFDTNNFRCLFIRKCNDSLTCEIIRQTVLSIEDSLWAQRLEDVPKFTWTSKLLWKIEVSSWKAGRGSPHWQLFNAANSLLLSSCLHSRARPWHWHISGTSEGQLVLAFPAKTLLMSSLKALYGWFSHIRGIYCTFSLVANLINEIMNNYE